MAFSYVQSSYTQFSAATWYKWYLHQYQHFGNFKKNFLLVVPLNVVCGLLGLTFAILRQLPAPSVLCHCSGPLVINVSYANETSTLYTNFVLSSSEYRSDVVSYSRTLNLEKAECWRQYSVSVAYQSPIGGALFSSAITLDNSELSMCLIGAS